MAYANNIEMDEKSGTVGDILTFKIIMNNVPNKVEAFAMDIQFDNKLLQFLGKNQGEGWTKGELIENFNFFELNLLEDNIIRFGRGC